MQFAVCDSITKVLPNEAISSDKIIRPCMDDQLTGEAINLNSFLFLISHEFQLALFGNTRAC